MRLTTRGRYGMRAMVELARCYGDGPMLMSSISGKQEIPRKYLHALLTSLRASGLVRSVRGSRGGYVLARAPLQITAADILKALEGPFLLVDCDERGTRCKMYRSCATRELWAGLGRAIERHLTEITLAELAGRSGDAPARKKA